MHLLFVTPAYPPFTGGGERYVHSLALALHKRGHALTVVTSQARSEQEFWLGTSSQKGLTVEKMRALTVVRCPVAPVQGGWKGLLIWRKLMTLISSLPGEQSSLLQKMARQVPPIQEMEQALSQLPDTFDLVNGFNISWEHALLTAQHFARRRALPFVVTPFAHLGEGKRTRVARNSMMDHQRKLLGDADAILALTEIEQEGFAAWGIEPAYLRVIGSGVDVVSTLADPAGLLVDYQLSRPFALFIGRMSYDKGTMHAVEAIRRLAQQGESLSLVLVGQVTSEFEHYWRVLPTEVKHRVYLLGKVEETVKHALLEQASMLLLPSRTDSFGIVLLEAWLHQTPVIGAAVGGIARVIDHGNNGLLVPFGDVPALAQAMRQLLAQPSLRAEMGRRGHEKVMQQYTWDRVAGSVLDTYQHVLGQSAS